MKVVVLNNPIVLTHTHTSEFTPILIINVNGMIHLAI